jgi:putative serine protease PepD
MPRRPRQTTIVASLLAAACLGAGGGAVAYATLSDGDTVVKQVTVKQGEAVASSSAPLSVNQIYRGAYRGVVEITVTTSGGGASPFGGGEGTSQAQGSGWVFDTDGHVVTNDHVVDGAQSISVRFWNGKTYTAKVVGTDKSTDLAVIKVDAPASMLHPLQVGDSSAVQVGDGVVAIGSPFGLEETVTSGIVSALDRTIDAPNNFTISGAIQTDTAINHGNSGGPLLNSGGQVIGINSQIESDSGGSDGVGFAIPSDSVRRVAQQLIASGKVAHAYLGVQLTDSGSAGGATVAQAVSSGPGADAGLRTGDVVTAIDGKAIGSSDALVAAVDSHKPGDQVTLTVKRGGDTSQIKVKLGTRPN